MDSPYQLSWAEISELTDRQLIEVYYRKRDKDGIPLPMDTEHDRAEVTPEKMLERERIHYYAMGATFGIPKAELDAAWEKRMEKANGR